MKLPVFLFSISFFSLGIVPVGLSAEHTAEGIAQTTNPIETNINPTDTNNSQSSLTEHQTSDIPYLSEIEHFETSAKLLVQQPTPIKQAQTKY